VKGVTFIKITKVQNNFLFKTIYNFSGSQKGCKHEPLRGIHVYNVLMMFVFTYGSPINSHVLIGLNDPLQSVGILLNERSRLDLTLFGIGNLFGLWNEHVYILLFGLYWLQLSPQIF